MSDVRRSAQLSGVSARYPHHCWSLREIRSRISMTSLFSLGIRRPKSPGRDRDRTGNSAQAIGIWGFLGNICGEAQLLARSHFAIDVEKNGGDDETRTRDLCRDRAPMVGN